MSESPARPRNRARLPLAEVAGLLGLPAPNASVELTGITLATSRLQAGDLYAALPGTRVHGATYAEQAVAGGAVAVLTDPDGAALLERIGVPVLVVPEVRPVLGEVSALIYGQPTADLTVLGVTGTQGKTTTTRLLDVGLTGAGYRSAVIGTVGTRLAGDDLKTALTTPEAPDLQALFALMREREIGPVAMEVSSHALALGRVGGVIFDVAVFLNLGRDHLDFHPDLEDYFAAKASLFRAGQARRGLANRDDEYGRRLLAAAEIPMQSFSLEDERADWFADRIDSGPGGSTFRWRGPDGVHHDGAVQMPGQFNVANAVAAIAAAGIAGLDATRIAGAIAVGGGVPGRLEKVDAGQDFLAVVDYAHKPDAVRAALRTLRPVTQGPLIVVLGAGGDRDPGKRPLMGRIAAEEADVVVITDDNPRSEDPALIRVAVRSGAEEVPLSGRAEVIEIGDRGEAIAWAVARAAEAGAGSTVLVAGKGHETGQEVAGVVHPFEDRAQLVAALRSVTGTDQRG